MSLSLFLNFILFSPTPHPPPLSLHTLKFTTYVLCILYSTQTLTKLTHYKQTITYHTSRNVHISLTLTTHTLHTLLAMYTYHTLFIIHSLSHTLCHTLFITHSSSLTLHNTLFITHSLSNTQKFFQVTTICLLVDYSC